MANILFPVNRREIMQFATAGVAAVAGSALAANRAEAADVVKRLAPRGHDGIYARQPMLEIESKGDFYAGFSVWRGQELEEAAEKRAMDICKAKGIDPSKNMSWGEAVALISEDPLISMTCRARSSHQKLKYDMVQLWYHNHADQFIE